MPRIAGLNLLLTLLFLLPGCASFNDLPAGSRVPISASPVVTSQAVAISENTQPSAPATDYRVGAGDVLYVNIDGHPELGSPMGQGSSAVAGSRVDGAGQLHLPLIGEVPVAGLTLSKIQTLLRQKFSVYLAKPWVVVEISAYKSQPLYLIGQFRNAGTYYMDRPLTLLQGIALGGGMLDTANLRSARLIRGGQIMPIDIYRLLRQGAMEQNRWLKAGDTLFVPDDKNQNVFVFGAVQQPGPVAMPNGRLTLAQALASAKIDGTTENRRYLRVIRSYSATRGELLVLDLDRVLRGEVLPYPLMEGDIIYVPRSAIGNWNQALHEILPSLQTLSAVLQPFVQINYLKNQ